jgi:hypothetical protein
MTRWALPILSVLMLAPPTAYTVVLRGVPGRALLGEEIVMKRIGIAILLTALAAPAGATSALTAARQVWRGVMFGDRGNVEFRLRGQWTDGCPDGATFCVWRGRLTCRGLHGAQPHEWRSAKLSMQRADDSLYTSLGPCLFVGTYCPACPARFDTELRPRFNGLTLSCKLCPAGAHGEFTALRVR